MVPALTGSNDRSTAATGGAASAAPGAATYPLRPTSATSEQLPAQRTLVRGERDDRVARPADLHRLASPTVTQRRPPAGNGPTIREPHHLTATSERHSNRSGSRLKATARSVVRNISTFRGVSLVRDTARRETPPIPVDHDATRSTTGRSSS
jgi:hypothetical protein